MTPSREHLSSAIGKQRRDHHETVSSSSGGGHRRHRRGPRRRARLPPERRRRTASLPASVKVGATAGVGAGASAVGTDQALAGGLGDIQVRVSAQNGKITSVGLAKLNVHGPQSAQITGSVVPQLIQETHGCQRRPHPGRLRRHLHEPGVRRVAAGRARQDRRDRRHQCSSRNQ